MFDDVIKLCCRQSDLLRTPEFWQAASFEQRMSEIREAVKIATGYYPTKNMQPIREGVFKNMVSRQYEKANVTEGGSFGAGRRWRLETVNLSDIQKKELDLLYDDMIEFSGKGRAK